MANPIFKPSTIQKNKTLNEDDEEIISKWKSSKMAKGRISKKNLDRIILSKQQDDEEDEFGRKFKRTSK